MKRSPQGRFAASTIDYCNVCNESWSRRKFKFLQKQFDEMNKKVRPRPPLPSNKVSLNDDQRSWILTKYFDKNGLTCLCKKHIKEFGNFGDGVYQSLRVSASRAADYEPPVFDQVDPLTVKQAIAKYRYHPVTNPNASPPKKHNPWHKKSRATMVSLQKFFKENTHPLPDKAPIRIFFADIPSYRKLYKLLYLKENPKGTPHYLAWSTWNFYRRMKFPWVKKQQKTKAACNTCCTFWAEKDRYHKWKAKTDDLESVDAQKKISEFKAKEKLWEIHREQNIRLIWRRKRSHSRAKQTQH